MNRATLKVSQATAARLRAAMVDLSSDAGESLTIDGALDYLLTGWYRYLAKQGVTERAPRRPAGRARSGQA